MYSSNSQKEIRVYAQVGCYYQETPYVQLQDGSRSRKPVDGTPQLIDALFAKEQEQLRKIIIDEALGCGGSTSMGKGKPVVNQEVEEGRINLTLSTTEADAPGIARIGLGNNSVDIFGGLAASENLTIGGDFGDKTLEAIAKLSELGKLRIKRMHFNADNAEVFDATAPRLRKFSHTGVCNHEVKVYYPQASAEDDNTTIRDMDAKYMEENGLEIVYDGRNFTRIDIPKGRKLQISIYTTYHDRD